jgi:hypothetical protein
MPAMHQGLCGSSAQPQTTTPTAGHRGYLTSFNVLPEVIVNTAYTTTWPIEIFFRQPAVRKIPCPNRGNRGNERNPGNKETQETRKSGKWSSKSDSFFRLSPVVFPVCLSCGEGKYKQEPKDVKSRLNAKAVPPKIPSYARSCVSLVSSFIVIIEILHIATVATTFSFNLNNNYPPHACRIVVMTLIPQSPQSSHTGYDSCPKGSQLFWSRLKLLPVPCL